MPEVCDWSSDDPMRLGRLYDQVVAIVEPGETVLDVGCGNGALCRRLLDAGVDAYGVDVSEQAINVAQGIDPDRFAVMDIATGRLPATLKDKDIDVVISTEVIEHLFAPDALCDVAAEVLTPSGRLIISTPYHGYLKSLLIALGHLTDHHYNPLWTGGHIKFWSPSTLTTLLQRNGFMPIRFQGYGRVPYLWKSIIVEAQRQ